MAHGEAPGSGQASFFICTGECQSLDGTYTAFARVVQGMDVVKAIDAVPLDGETPRELVVVRRVRLSRR